MKNVPAPRPALAGVCFIFALFAARAFSDTVDLDALTRIRKEGFRNSKVMETLGELTDRIGPRLTASPNARKASEWTRERFAAFGLENARVETWGPFGEGWSQEFASVRMLAPDMAQLYAIPRPWTPSTEGAVRGPAIHAAIKAKEDLPKYKGKLGGKIVLLGEVTPSTSTPAPNRYSEQDLDGLAHYAVPGEGAGPATRADSLRRNEFAKQLRAFLAEEKPLAVIIPSRSTDGTIFVQTSGSMHEPDKHDAVATLVMASEHYARMTRLLGRKVPVELEVNVATTFHRDIAPANTLAEIPGTDPQRQTELVMLGAHLDSWHGGTGATDNAVGCAVVMEAVRILKAAGLAPRRTIRAALWTGEEQGLLGSRAYVSQHFASRADPTDKAERELPRGLWREEGRPLSLKPDHARVAGYFNFDNGAGKIRGIYAQENSAIIPIFESWIAPIKDLGVTTVTHRNTGSTDHVPFDSVGLPGFQFIQDALDYEPRTHHSNMDVMEHVKREDAMQASVVMAWFVYNAAMRDGMLPRKPMPSVEPKAKDTVAKTSTD